MQIHATFTQDLVDGSLTLTDFHPKDAQLQPINEAPSPDIAPPITTAASSASASTTQTSLLLSNSALLSNGSKILVSSEGDAAAAAQGSINSIFIQPGIIFESIDYQSLPAIATESGEFVLQAQSALPPASFGQKDPDVAAEEDAPGGGATAAAAEGNQTIILSHVSASGADALLQPSTFLAAAEVDAAAKELKSYRLIEQQPLDRQSGAKLKALGLRDVYCNEEELTVAASKSSESGK